MKVSKKMLFENYNNLQVAEEIYEKHKTKSFAFLPDNEDKEEFGIYLSLLYGFKDYGFSNEVKYATIFKNLLKENKDNVKFLNRPTSLYKHNKELMPFKSLMKIAECLNAINFDFYEDVYYYAVVNVYKRSEHANSTAVLLEEVAEEYYGMLNVLNIPCYEFNNVELDKLNGLVITGKKISLKKFYDIERGIENQVYSHPLTKVNDIDLPKVTSEGFTLTQKQYDTCNFISKYDGVFVVQGEAGTGKTLLANHILRNNDYKTVLLSAPSAQAAKVISHATQIAAHTMASVILKPQLNDKDFDVVIVDETSMVDNYQLLKFLESLTSLKKLIFLGDINQLASVSRGQLLKDLQRSDKVKTFKLTEVKRYDSGILSYAQAILQDKYYPKVSKEVSYSTEIDNPYKLLAYLDRNEYFKDVTNNKILSPEKGGELGVYRANVTIQNARLQREEIGGQYLSTQFYKFYKDDKVIFNKNTRIGADYYQNGSEFIIEKIIGTSKLTLRSLFDDSIHTLYFDNIQDVLELSYATTIHKSQGSSYNNLFIIGKDNTAAFLFTRQMLYTAVTRAKVHCHMLLEKDIYRRIQYKKEKTCTTLFQI